MKRILIAVLLATALLATGCTIPHYAGKTALYDDKNKKCLDMKGNLLSGKAELRGVFKDASPLEIFCVDGERIREREYRYLSTRRWIERRPSLVAERTYKNGELEVGKSFYESEVFESGALRSETPYKNGKREGLAKSFYDTPFFERGALRSETPYKNGKREGVAKSFYENGRLEEEIPYKNDVADGIGKTYYESGKLNEEITWKNGKTYYGIDSSIREGEKKVFREDGTIWGIFTYEKDKPISGVCYKINGEKRPFTEAELENLSKNWNNWLKITCD
ncbi:MAG: toxin-antitoxin system YwqK family antitoxin [Helicobacteraceae bacterium]|jgi:hypothetical protein|nr:toxin-antitoxin system YwqK family antitoxin [Helicobacteraceae bacterium]